MGSKTSKPKRPAGKKTSTCDNLKNLWLRARRTTFVAFFVPCMGRCKLVIPQDIVDEILDHLAADSDFESLRACALVSRSWAPSCRRHLFHTADLTWLRVNGWLYSFPLPEESPAHHFRVLRLTIRGNNWFPDKFLEHAPRFTNVRELSLFGGEDYFGSRPPSRWRLPESITSLTIDGSCGISFAAIWDIMAQLPKLDDLNLWGDFIPVDRRALLEIGTVPRGRFGGELVVRGIHYGNAEPMKLLSEIPTAFHFTKVEIYCARQYIPSVIRLVERCRKTLVKLSLNVFFGGKYHPSSGPVGSGVHGTNADATPRWRS